MQESGQLVQAVTAACEVAGLQAVPALVSKCLQLQDTMAVRFGVMLVGPAGMLTHSSHGSFFQPSCLQCHLLLAMLLMKNAAYEIHLTHLHAPFVQFWLLPLGLGLNDHAVQAQHVDFFCYRSEGLCVLSK